MNHYLTKDYWQAALNRPAAAVAVGLIIGSIIIFPDIRTGLLKVLPYLIFLACPLMHIFMHRHHGGHGDHQLDRHIDATSPVKLESEDFEPDRQN